MMNITKLLVLAGALAAAGIAQADTYTDWARVRSVTPQYSQVNVPRQECSTEYIQPGAPEQRSERGYGGAVIGGLAGGLLGNQLGNGHGREAATAAGAVIGALTGDNLENRDNQRYNNAPPPPQEVRRCRQIDDVQTRITGYRVTYDYAGRHYTSIMPNDPGGRIAVRVDVQPQ